MSNPSSQHQAVCALVEEYPELVRELADLTGVIVPAQGRPVAAPTSYPMPDGSTIQGDATVHFPDQSGKPRFFAQVEMQNKYSLGKLATLRGYHGGEVRRSQCGGHTWVLSPKGSEARSFIENEALHREEYAFRASYVSGSDLAPFAAPHCPLSSRALAAVMTDLESDGVPCGARSLLLELQEDGKEHVADLIAKAMIEKCADLSDLEADMTDAAMDRLMTLPSFREFVSRRAATAQTSELRDALETYFASRGDTPSDDGFAVLEACDSPKTLRNWLHRAYNGETSSQILKKP